MTQKPTISVNELLQRQNEEMNAKPKFLSKKERKKLQLLQEKQQLNVHKPSPKRTISKAISDNGAQILPDTKKAKSVTKNKFSFDWDNTEDTSQDFDTLVQYEKVSNTANLGLEDVHWSAKPLEKMTARDWRIFREDYNISSKGGNIAHPLRNWRESTIPDKILEIVDNILKFNEPTPIQRATIPLALSLRDVVGIAETGSGKTLAFLIPFFAYLIESVDPNYLELEHVQENKSNNTLGLILAPTRELALQISNQATIIGKELGFNVVTVIGGHQYEETIFSIKNGVHLVVATPGRLIDSVERGIINLSKCHYLIMDEADKMVDMGFEKSIQSIMSYLPSSPSSINSMTRARVTLMFTATITPAIEKITRSYLENPASLIIGNIGEAIDNIDQQFEYTYSSDNKSKSSIEIDSLNEIKSKKLLQLIQDHVKSNKNYLIIIFANYKKICELLSQFLDENRFNDNVVIHGSKSQEFRERAIQNFRSGTNRILIATDVAARGIDIPNVSLVINYQMTKKIDEYVHRIGRTGRAGNKGSSITFLDDSDSDVFLDLKKFLSKGKKKCPPWLLNHTSTRIKTINE